MAEKPLHRELEYYIAHQGELVKAYRGKVIVIKDDAVLGAYGSVAEAVEETMKSHALGTFLVQRCERGPASYSATFCGYRVAPAT